MNMNNLCIFTGRLVADVEYKETVNGTPHVNFKLAVDGRYNKDTREKETEFIYFDAWREQAKHVSQRCQKGDILQVASQFRQYKKQDGSYGYSFTAESIQGPYTMNWHDQSAQANGFQPQGGFQPSGQPTPPPATGFQPVGQSTESLPGFAPSGQTFGQPTPPPAPSFDPIAAQESQGTADINDDLPFLN